MGFAAAAQGAQGIIEGIQGAKAADAEEDIVKANAANDQEAMRKQQRAEFGSMLASAGGSGIAVSSFEDIFNNQTMQDAAAMTQLKQVEQNQIASAKTNKKNAITGGVMGAAMLGGAGAKGWMDMDPDKKASVKGKFSSMLGRSV